MVFYGRSDAVLNPGGVRIGTAEIYRQVDSMPEVVEGLAVGQEWGSDVRVVLFLKLENGILLEQALTQRVKQRIRKNASPDTGPARSFRSRIFRELATEKSPSSP
jgi:acetoacetyl-CoA synthetase